MGLQLTMPMETRVRETGCKIGLGAELHLDHFQDLSLNGEIHHFNPSLPPSQGEIHHLIPSSILNYKLQAGRLETRTSKAAVEVNVDVGEGVDDMGLPRPIALSGKDQDRTIE